MKFSHHFQTHELLRDLPLYHEDDRIKGNTKIFFSCFSFTIWSMNMPDKQRWSSLNVVVLIQSGYHYDKNYYNSCK